MGFIERATSMYQRGEHARAFVILCEGLKRQPNNPDALEQLLQIYIHDIPNPGMERDLLIALNVQANGHEVFELVAAELQEHGMHGKVRALDEVLEREGFIFEPPAPPPPRHEPVITRQVAERPTPREHWEAFDDPRDPPVPDEVSAKVVPLTVPEPEPDHRTVRESPSFHQPRSASLDFVSQDVKAVPPPAASQPWALAIALLALIVSCVSLYLTLTARTAAPAEATSESIDTPAIGAEELNPTPTPVESVEEPQPLPPRGDQVVDEDETDQLE